ncbi:NDP-sugar synthase, partial [Actinomadura sp. 7K507]|uniref:nucleotidyltransferase family protein n=1 Tax=Actinomadura sp. 7K507 TaxID=2530365 RepID=UPI001042B78C
PKPLLPTAGVAFLAHQLARAHAEGVTRIVFATSYRAEMFEAAFGTHAHGVDLAYVSEDEPLGTGGAIRNASRALTSGPDDPVLILNGDILSGHDVRAQVKLHEQAAAAATLHLTRVDDPSRFGCVPTDDQGRVTAFLEKTPNPVTNQINAGCYVFRRSAIDTIPEDEVVSVERETFPSMIASGAVVMGHVESGYWLDVGTPQAFVQGSRDLVLGTLSSPAMPGAPGEHLTLAGASVAPGAVVRGGTTVGRGAVIEAGATVIGSVLLDDAHVAEGATVRDSVLSRGARVGHGAVLDGAILGDGAIVGPGNELREGLRVWPGIE